MRTREIVCENYICEGQCKLGKESKFYGYCQKCSKYKKKAGAKPARTDNRRSKREKQERRDMRE